MLVYSGELEVEDGGFELVATRIVIRENEVAFSFSGQSVDGEFRTEGIAKLDSDGKWISGPVGVNYLNYSNKAKGDAVIRFLVINPSSQKYRCKVAGEWRENGQIWAFAGSLLKFKSS